MNPDIAHLENEINLVVDRLKLSKSVFVITGAGMSADSGLPTYRGIGGLYDNVNTEDGLSIEQALSGPVFRQRPEITWKYLGQVERSCRGAKYDRGHEVLSMLESHFERFWILTQNIDGFHTAAGSKNVIEIHGNLSQLLCLECDHQYSVADYSQIAIPPVCPECDGPVRPKVVLFEEQLPQAALEIYDCQTRIPFDTVMTIGTSSYFPYIIQPVVQAAQNGNTTIEINPGKTPVSDIVDIKLSAAAAVCLHEIYNRLKQ